jgi:hypothetical protein
VGGESNSIGVNKAAAVTASSGSGFTGAATSEARGGRVGKSLGSNRLAGSSASSLAALSAAGDKEGDGSSAGAPAAAPAKAGKPRLGAVKLEKKAALKD